MKFRSIALLSLLAATAPAYAGDFYVLGSVGSAKVEIDQGGFDDALRSLGAGNVSSSVDEKDTGFKLQFGYQFNPNFAIEGGFVDLGEAQYDARFTGGTYNAKFSAKGINVSALGILPVNESFSVFGKLGFISAKVEVEESAAGSLGTGSGSVSDKSVSPILGVGALYNISKSVAIRAEYERFANLGDDNETGEADVDLVSVGVSFKF